MALEEKVIEKFKFAKSDEALESIPEDNHDLYMHYITQEENYVEHELTESTTTANIDKVVSVFIPAISKLARDSFIEKIYGVQPIDDKIALIDYIDIVYDDTDANAKPGVTAGDSVVDNVTEEYSRDPGEMQTINRGLRYVHKEKEARARSRKMNSDWSWEAQDSLRKKKINLETELTKAMSAKLVEEINYELLYLLYGVAPQRAEWDAPLASDAPPVKMRKEDELYYTIEDVSSSIYDDTRRFPNFVVMNPKMASYLKRSGNFKGQGFVSSGEKNPRSIQRMYREGSLNDEYMVIVVPNMTTNDILVGYKGASELEAGAIYCPYIPLIVMESFFDTKNWSWIRSVGSFYAESHDIMTKLYGKIKVNLS